MFGFKFGSKSNTKSGPNPESNIKSESNTKPNQDAKSMSIESDDFEVKTQELAPGVFQTITFLNGIKYDKFITVNGEQCNYASKPSYIKYFPYLDKKGKSIPEVMLFNDYNPLVGHIDLLGRVDFHDNRSKKLTERYSAGKLHTSDNHLPSRTVYRRDDTVYSKEWHRNGVLLCKELYAKDGNKLLGLFEYEDGKLKKSTSYYDNKVTTLVGNIITTRIMDYTYPYPNPNRIGKMNEDQITSKVAPSSLKLASSALKFIPSPELTQSHPELTQSHHKLTQSYPKLTQSYPKLSIDVPPNVRPLQRTNAPRPSNEPNYLRDWEEFSIDEGINMSDLKLEEDDIRLEEDDLKLEDDDIDMNELGPNFTEA